MEREGYFDNNSLWDKINNGEILLLDTRLVNEYTKKHVPGSLCAPFSRSGWGRMVARYLGNNETEVAILSTNDTIAKAAASEMENEEFKVVAIISDGLESWESSGLPVAAMWEITPEDLYNNLESYTVIDVRDPFEWQSGLIPGSIKLSMNELSDKLTALSKDKKYALVCASGNRSQSAALYLADNGFDAGNVVGGIARWISRSLPLDYE